MPTCYEDDDDKPYLITDTDDLNIVSQYSGLNFIECLELDCYTFRKLLINAFITKMRSSQEGQEWLENAYILTLTDIDTSKLRELFGKKEG